MGKGIIRFVRSHRGQSMIEFALVAPLLLGVMIGIAEFGRAWMTNNTCTSAAREAARVAAVSAGDLIAAYARANVMLNSAGLTPTSVNVNINPTTRVVTATVNVTFVSVVGGFIGLGNIPLTGQTTMRWEN